MAIEILEQNKQTRDQVLNLKVDYLSKLMKAYTHIEVAAGSEEPEEKVQELIPSPLPESPKNGFMRYVERVLCDIFSTPTSSDGADYSLKKPPLKPEIGTKYATTKATFDQKDPRDTEHCETLMKVMNDALFGVEVYEKEEISFMTALGQSEPVAGATKACVEAINFVHYVIKKGKVEQRSEAARNKARAILTSLVECNVDIYLIDLMRNSHDAVGRKYVLKGGASMNKISNAASILSTYREELREKVVGEL